MFMNQGRHSGWIEVICGPMFSGKTEELIRRLKLSLIAKQKVQIFKPLTDNRYSEEHIVSHDEQKFICTPVTSPKEILDRIKDHTHVIAVDEAQFFDGSIVDVCEKLANRGMRVIVAGLDQDYLGNPFGPMPQLLSVAESILKLKAICMVCGGLASKSQRLTGENSQILVGSKNHYEARCRACFDPDLGIESQEHLLNSTEDENDIPRHLSG